MKRTWHERPNTRTHMSCFEHTHIAISHMCETFKKSFIILVFIFYFSMFRFSVDFFDKNIFRTFGWSAKCFRTSAHVRIINVRMCKIVQVRACEWACVCAIFFSHARTHKYLCIYSFSFNVWLTVVQSAHMYRVGAHRIYRKKFSKKLLYLR